MVRVVGKFAVGYTVTIDALTKKLSRPSEWMCSPRFYSPVSESVIREVLLLKGGGDLSRP